MVSDILLPFAPKYWPRVQEIYQHGILSRNATFETEVPDFDAWDKKFHSHLRWVAISGNEVTGWAALSAVSPRKVYEGVAEISIYIHPAHAGKGLGKLFMEHLIAQSEVAGIWTLYASIFPENTASIRLHEVFGFRKIGHREKIAQLDGIWRDTVLYEKRSKNIGV
jgi:phosphinothricin acetyltransferase